MEVPIRVEYEITPVATKLKPILLYVLNSAGVACGIIAAVLFPHEEQLAAAAASANTDARAALTVRQFSVL